MESIKHILDFFLHIDKHLLDVVQTYGSWTYGILFAIIFMETGLVVTPFLPGDSLIFAAGALAGADALEIRHLLPLLIAAAVLGDNLNYVFGRTIGPRVFQGEKNRFFNREHLDRTHEFYAKHGGKTLILARFVPIIRTFAPFVAGIGHMRYPRFLVFSLAGGTLWVSLFGLLGYFFGGLPVVKENFSIAVLVIIALSLTPMIVEIWKMRTHRGDSREIS
jgi:membrane-associated protein